MSPSRPPLQIQQKSVEGSSTDFKIRGKELVQPEFVAENGLILLTRRYQLFLLSYLRSQGKQTTHKRFYLD